MKGKIINITVVMKESKYDIEDSIESLIEHLQKEYTIQNDCIKFFDYEFNIEESNIELKCENCGQRYSFDNFKFKSDNFCESCEACNVELKIVKKYF